MSTRGGDRVQIVLAAKDELSGEINKSQRQIRALKSDLVTLNKQIEAGDKEAARAYEAKRKAYDDEERKLGSLIRKRSELTKQERALAKQTRELGKVADLTNRRLGNMLTVNTSRTKRLTYAARQFKREWSSAIGTVQRRLSTLNSKIKTVSRNAESSGLLKIGRTGAIAAGVGAAAVTGIGLKTASDLEQTQITFEQMMGSAEEAGKMMEWLKATAAKTPFELQGLTQATQRLMAYGFTAKEARSNLLTIGDAASATGMGAEGIERVSTALGQMNAKQKIQGEEMRQLTEAGIPAWEILADKMGKTVPELQAMMSTAGGGNALFEAGGLPALIDGLGDKYDGLMEKQSQTLAGLWSTLKDTIALASADLVEKYMPQIKKGIKGAIDGVTGAFELLKKIIDKVGPVIEKIITFITHPDHIQGFKAAAIAIGVMTAAMMALNFAMAINPVTLIVLGIAALVGALVWAYNKFDWFKNFVDSAFAAIKVIIGGLVTFFREYVWPALKKYIGFMVGYYKFLWKIVSTVFTGIVNVVRGGWQKVGGFFRAAKDRIVSIVTTIKDAIKGIWDGLTEGLRSKIDTIKNFLQKIPGWSLIDGLFFAGGPVTSGTTGLVGEIGPEIFVPNGGGSPSLIGADGPEVRKFHESGVIIPNHLIATVPMPRMAAEPALVGAGGPSVEIGEMHVHSEIDAESALTRAMLRADRISRERR